jgi:hypothetical protein
MALDGEAVNREALENETKIKKQFEKLKYSVERLSSARSVGCFAGHAVGALLFWWVFDD